jgi:hypothetical protein
MAHFAELDIFKKVLRVLAVDDKDTQDEKGNEVESIGQSYLHAGLGGTWLKTSYNTYNGVHQAGGTPFRKNYAVIGGTYDETRDAFLPPKPYASWVLNETTAQWGAPVAKPGEDTTEINYKWNEGTTLWDTYVFSWDTHTWTKE